jgi:hypothetical protein
MADYKDIIGLDIEVKSADPDNPSDGQVWFNTAGNLKYKKANVAGTWSTSGDLNNGRRLGAGSGTQTAGLCFGGSAVCVPDPAPSLLPLFKSPLVDQVPATFAFLYFKLPAVLNQT